MRQTRVDKLCHAVLNFHPNTGSKITTKNQRVMRSYNLQNAQNSEGPAEGSFPTLHVQ